MAKVILHPKACAENARRMQELNDRVQQRRAEVYAGWGPEYVERVHAKGKLTSWERMDLLKDPGTVMFPINRSAATSFASMVPISFPETLSVTLKRRT